MSDGALSYLFGATPPPSVTSNTATTNGLPDWYQQYLSGIAGKATQVAGAQANADIPAQSTADFNQDQVDAFQQVRDNQGAWKPLVGQAATAAQGIVPGSTNLINQAQSSVAGPAQSWNSNVAAQYMSPYTDQVIQNIQRLGQRNLQENLLPGVQDQFIGAGQFGSTRNADIIGRTVRDANNDITGQIANALNSGYTNAQTMFTQDANRQQAQQQLQANTAIQGANANTTAGQTGAQTLGALGQSTAALGLNDAQQLNAIGTQEQNLQQEGLNTDYANQVNSQNFDWNTLNNLNSVVRGLQLPQTAVSTTNAPLSGSQYGASPLAQIGGALGTLGK